MSHKQIIDALNWRYAVKTFDSSRKIDEKDLNTILESGRLAPSSIGIEPWKFLVIKNVELRNKLRAAGYDQTKITDSSELVVITRRTDADKIALETVNRVAQNQNKNIEDLQGLKDTLDGAISRQIESNTINSWFASQTYLPLAFMIQTAAQLGIDTCPMEGFDTGAVDEILDLKSKNLASVTMLSIGYRGDDKYANAIKSRKLFNEVVEVI